MYLTINPEVHFNESFAKLSVEAKWHALTLWMECCDTDSGDATYADAVYAGGPKVASELMESGWVVKTPDGNYMCTCIGTYWWPVDDES